MRVLESSYQLKCRRFLINYPLKFQVILSHQSKKNITSRLTIKNVINFQLSVKTHPSHSLFQVQTSRHAVKSCRVTIAHPSQV